MSFADIGSEFLGPPNADVGLLLLPFFQVDAFAHTAFAGNPAGVVLSERPLPDAMMKAIAAEHSLAEVAFVWWADSITELRWFTPTQEVPFCGHATLAAAHILFSEYGRRGPIDFSTRIGVLSVTRAGSELTLEMPALPPEPLPEVEAPLASVCPVGWLSAFANFENFFLELGSELEVRTYAPDCARIAALHPMGLSITAPGNSVDFVSRYFAPSYGIPEDAVTGSIHATLAPFWARRLEKSRLLARQLSPRGGEMRLLVTDAHVQIAAEAVTYLKGTIYVPREW